MLPTNGRTLHVRSTRVLLDGHARPATLALREHADGRRVVTDVDPDTAPADVEDLGDAIVAPAPLDLHFHGAGGIVVPPVGDARAIDEFLRSVDPAPYDWIATLPVPSVPPVDPVEHVATCAAALVGTRCAGIRIEGLFLNPTRAGVWPPQTFRAPDVDLLDRLHDAAGGRLRIVDVAPELPGAIQLITRLVEHGIVASLAHTDATWEQARTAIDAGASLATHTWNAMRPTTHRDPGVVAAVLADPRVTCELICDGVHLHPGTIALSIAACGSGGWAAISDASPFAGCEPGDYDWAGTTVHHDGVALRDVEGRLAGSASLLWRARRVLDAVEHPIIEQVLAMSAVPRRVLNPGRALGFHVGDELWTPSVSPT